MIARRTDLEDGHGCAYSTMMNRVNGLTEATSLCQSTCASFFTTFTRASSSGKGGDRNGKWELVDE